MAYLYQNPRQQALLAARQELDQLTQQQQALSQQQEAVATRMRQLQQTLPYLEAAAAQEYAPITVPLPNLCMRILSQSFTFMSVPEIRDRLKDLGIYVSGKNPLGILHTTMGRLAQSGFAEAGYPFPGAPIHYRITTAGRLALQD